MRTTLTTLTTLAALAVGALAGAAGCTAATPEPVVDCPAEDSCEVDYRESGWWVRTYDDSPTTQTPGPWVRVTR